ncbi:hypothetical protein NQZ68_037145 [Dissostichus eleginoides]|nr:hypothetical protein NQZ68_037145 [Dissostichus eleginoides]
MLVLRFSSSRIKLLLQQTRIQENIPEATPPPNPSPLAAVSRGPPPLPPPCRPPSLFPTKRPTSEQPSASRVFVRYKSSSRGANRSTPISAIISDSNYLQIQLQEEKLRSPPGTKTPLWFLLVRAAFTRKTRSLERVLALPGACLCVEGIRFMRCGTEDRTALSHDRPYLDRILQNFN